MLRAALPDSLILDFSGPTPPESANLAVDEIMTSSSGYEARHRPESELSSRWGIYALLEQRWLDVHFVSREEAERAIMILATHRPVPIQHRPIQR
jgi:hypothetical protein